MASFVKMTSGFGTKVSDAVRPTASTRVGLHKRQQRSRWSGRTLRPETIFPERSNWRVTSLETAAVSVGTTDPEASQEVDGSKRKQTPFHGQKAVIVGAGPSGSTAAELLARRGFDVQVFEKRKNPSEIPMTVHRSIVLVLNPEVTELLESMGVEIPPDGYAKGISEVQDSVMVSQDGQVKRVKAAQNKRRSMGERHDVANAILQAAISRELPNLKFNFESQCEGIDLNAKVARFSNAKGEIEEVPYDLLIGADGVGSHVRLALESSEFVKSKQRTSESRYISFRNLPILPNLPGTLADNIRVGEFMTISLKEPLPNARSRGCAYYRTENNCAQMILSGLPTFFNAIKGNERKWIDEAFPIEIPEEWKAAMVKDLQEKPLSTAGVATYCTSYIGPGVALIGDACHSATPIMGMGANQAILDGKALDAAMEKSNGNLKDALIAYDRNRRPQLAGLQDLELKHPNCVLEGRNQLWQDFCWLYLEFHSKGHELFPNLISPSVHQLLVRSEISGEAAAERFNREGWIFFISVGSAACGALAWALEASHILT